MIRCWECIHNLLSRCFHMGKRKLWNSICRTNNRSLEISTFPTRKNNFPIFIIACSIVVVVCFCSLSVQGANWSEHACLFYISSSLQRARNTKSGWSRKTNIDVTPCQKNILLAWFDRVSRKVIWSNLGLCYMASLTLVNDCINPKKKL